MEFLLSLLTDGVIIVLVIITNLVCIGFAAWLATIKGYSTGAWVLLGLFFGPLAVVSVGLAPNTNETSNSKINDINSKLDTIVKYYKEIEDSKRKAQDEIEKEIELKKKKEEQKIISERLGKINGVEDLLKDEKIRKEAEDIKRMYGQSVYESYLKKKAEELGVTQNT